MAVFRKTKLQHNSNDSILIDRKGGRSMKGFSGFVILVSLFTTTVGFATPSVFHVRMDGFSPYYVPKSMEVPVGTSVVWKNPTSTHHTITHDGCRNGKLCVFDSGSIAPNGQFGLYGLPPGRYSYHCALHPIMQGILIVTGGSHPLTIKLLLSIKET